MYVPAASGKGGFEVEVTVNCEADDALGIRAELLERSVSLMKLAFCAFKPKVDEAPWLTAEGLAVTVREGVGVVGGEPGFT